MWSLLFVSLLAAAPPIFQVEVLAGDPVAGTIVQLDADRVTVQTAQGPVSWETDQITGLSAQLTRGGTGVTPVAPGGVLPSAWVELVDGSRLLAADYSARDGLAAVTGLGGEVTELSTRDVRAVRLQPHTNAIAAEWSRILDSHVHSDLVVIRKGDSIDYHRGVLRDVTDKIVQFDLDGDLLPVKRAKVQGIVYYQSAGRSLPEPVCRVTDADGSCWEARSVVLEGGNLHWTTPLGLEITRAPSEVLRVDFSQGKIVYLSDLEPESRVWTPYFGSASALPSLAEFFAPREDRGLDLGPLALDGKRYQKGLALHSRTSLVYRLPGQFRRFKATVGIDDRVRPRGHVRLVITGDDRVLLETTVAGAAQAQSIDLDIAGVRRLAILVDYGDDLDVADHLDLCNARIVK